ncbi:MAG: anaerobic ribonucleoside-triphosphate reductase [Clostridiales bacterium]|nr:anaerobic ribonucleoside-triphosphate reductase [Clostridiales bacterium]
MKVIKRDDSIVEFDRAKIVAAIQKANAAVDEPYRLDEASIDAIADSVAGKGRKRLLVEDIQDMVETKLMAAGKYELAKAYIIYRYTRALVRKANTTDESILSLIRNDNKELAEENANKNTAIASTQRDYIAGEVSRDLTRRILLPEHISKAHDEGVLHFHDADYFVQHIFNCCLVNIGDMLDNGTMINGKLIEPPKSFQVACTVVTQIISCVASNQYGGQSVEMSHLGKYLRLTYEKYVRKTKETAPELDDATIEKLARARTRDELRSGVQTIQYQINTLMTTNGQSPFVTLFLVLREDDPYMEENAAIIQEILSQRLEGIKNEKGVYITPAFPKLVYVLDECNNLSGGKYDYLTELAVKCSAKRMYPDYISAKIMRETHNGNVYSPMGCRSFLTDWIDPDTGTYRYEGRFNQGVVSLNLPQIGILSGQDEDKFWKLLDERLELCYEALMCRHNALMGVRSDVSPIHWQYGAIARLDKGETIDKYLMDNYSTISLGYIGIYEVTKLVKGCSQTEPEGKDFALRLMTYLRDTCYKWRDQTGIGFSLYGTPAESLCYRFARIDKERFGTIPDVTDKGYYTNSYHVDVREEIDAFSKFQIESQFQRLSPGGAISYVEIPNMRHNLEALKDVVRFIYDNIQYAEFNTKSDYCQVCGYDGEIIVNDDNEWECPVCHNKDHAKMNVTRRTCGYLGENFWNEGKTREIKARVLHL